MFWSGLDNSELKGDEGLMRLRDGLDSPELRGDEALIMFAIACLIYSIILSINAMLLDVMRFDAMRF